MKNCGPEDSSKPSPREAFVAGDVAMYLGNSLDANSLMNPERSAVVGKVAIARHPVGKRYAPIVTGYGLGIPANAANKEAAFLLLQWLTSKQGNRVIGLAGGMPSRRSTFSDPEVLDKYPQLAAIGDALDDAQANPMLGNDAAHYATHAVRGDLMKMWDSTDISHQDALNAAVDETRTRMRFAGYYTWFGDD